MDNNSSYTFARCDGRQSNGDSLNASHDLLTQSGTDTSNIDTVNSHGSDAGQPPECERCLVSTSSSREHVLTHGSVPQLASMAPAEAARWVVDFLTGCHAAADAPDFDRLVSNAMLVARSGQPAIDARSFSGWPQILLPSGSTSRVLFSSVTGASLSERSRWATPRSISSFNRGGV